MFNLSALLLRLLNTLNPLRFYLAFKYRKIFVSFIHNLFVNIAYKMLHRLRLSNKILFGLLFFQFVKSAYTAPGNITTTEDDNSQDPIYILLVGLSGSGKSTTINVLFNTTVAPVGDFESTTSSIFEYSFGGSNGTGNEVRFIDTPGLEDTRGLENDANFLATLEKFMKNHRDLSVRPPDVVLICARYDDNRFYGESSKFVKMLRSLGILQKQIVSSTHSNLIFVMTHVMGVTEKEAKNTKNKTTQIEKAIKEFSLFPSPIKIVLAENKGDDNELERVEFGHKLPNGEIYPQNLFESIKSIIALDKKNVLTARKTQLLSSMSSGDTKNTPRLISEAALVPPGDTRAMTFLEMLTAANLKTENTEVSVHLADIFRKLPEKSDLPSDTLIYLQRALHLRLITKLSDIPKVDTEIATLFRELGRIKEVEILLKAAFGIKPPVVPLSSTVGNCYDITTDSILQSTPFKTDSRAEKFSDLGYASPSNAILTINAHNKYFYHKSASEDEYVKNRAFLLGVGKSSFKSMRKTLLKPGFNVISRGSCPSLLIEFRILRLDMDKVDLASAFSDQLKMLPVFNISVPNSVQKWRNFLTVYGSHVVTSAYAGGSTEVLIDNYPCNTIDLKDIFQDVISNGNQSILAKMRNVKRLKISGGDPNTYSENPDIFFFSKRTSLFENWKNSLVKFPMILNNDFELKPLEDILPPSVRSFASMITNAMKFFLEDQLYEHPLLTHLNRIEKEKSSLQTEHDLLVLKTTNLERNVEELGKAKTALENKTLGCTRELMTTKQSHSETKIELANEKISVKLHVDSIKSLNDSLVRLQSQINAEKSNSQELKTLLDYSNAKMNTLQIKYGDNQCGDILESNEGVIMYKYSSQYSNSERCVWIVRIPKTYTQIKFTKMPTEFELGYDYITIFSFNKEGFSQKVDLGDDGNGVQSGTLNGLVAVVMFTSDGSAVNSGFILHYKAMGMSQSNNYEYHKDYISSSPSGRLKYPVGSQYRDNEMSLFVISNAFFHASSSSTFTLRMKMLDLEKCGDGEACTCDRLIIYHVGRNDVVRRMRYCGNPALHNFASPDLFILVFATDSSVTKSGFEVEWSLS